MFFIVLENVLRFPGALPKAVLRLICSLRFSAGLFPIVTLLGIGLDSCFFLNSVLRRYYNVGKRLGCGVESQLFRLLSAGPLAVARLCRADFPRVENVHGIQLPGVLGLSRRYL